MPDSFSLIALLVDKASDEWRKGFNDRVPNLAFQIGEGDIPRCGWVASWDAKGGTWKSSNNSPTHIVFGENPGAPGQAPWDDAWGKLRCGEPNLGPWNALFSGLAQGEGPFWKNLRKGGIYNHIRDANKTVLFYNAFPFEYTNGEMRDWIRSQAGCALVGEQFVHPFIIWMTECGFKFQRDSVLLLGNKAAQMLGAGVGSLLPHPSR
ncbi:MAG: hypothetical protein JST05_04335 [Acidobacteria bacterium]|nr:hypothetical protein [Acidobacteriota bacterium]